MELVRTKFYEGKGTGQARDLYGNEEVEKLRLSVLDHVRRENPLALKDPRANVDYLSITASAQAIRLNLPTGDLVNDIVNDLLGYGPLQKFIFPTENEFMKATEVMVTRHDLFYVEVEGELREVYGAGCRDQEQLISLMRRIAASANNRIDLSSPTVVVSLPDGSRACMFIPPLSGIPFMNIRRFPEPLTWSDLLAREAITTDALAFLRECAALNLNTIFTGNMGSGKTTNLNCFISLISEAHSPSISVVTLEKVPELQPRHINIRPVYSRPPNLEGKGEINLVHIARTSLLAMRPDWIIWAEMQGPEVYHAIQMGNLGHPFAGTVHSPSAVAAVTDRLPGAYRTDDAAKNLTEEEVKRKIRNVVDIASHSAKVRLPNGKARRQTVQIAEVLSNECEPRVLYELDRKTLLLEQVAEPKIFLDKDKRRWW